MAPPQIFMVLLMYCSFFIIICGNFATANVDTKKLYTICSGVLVNEFLDDEFDYGLDYAMSDLIKNTPKAELHEYYVKEPLGYKGQRYIYGHGECTSTLSDDECYSCLREAQKQMESECTHSVGAQTQLMDCRLRYENYYFNNDG